MAKKSIKTKPQFYAYLFYDLHKIAKKCGYNLALHGSLNRDMDLIAVPWIDEPKEHLVLLHKFCDCLGVQKFTDIAHYYPAVMGGGRISYHIDLCRTETAKYTKSKRWVDKQYYLDISITPLVAKPKKVE